MCPPVHYHKAVKRYIINISVKLDYFNWLYAVGIMDAIYAICNIQTVLYCLQDVGAVK